MKKSLISAMCVDIWGMGRRNVGQESIRQQRRHMVLGSSLILHGTVLSSMEARRTILLDEEDKTLG
jgi:hypothetical protein